MAKAQAKSEQSASKEATPEPVEVPSIPARGSGPFGGYPVPAGATHFRIHPVNGKGQMTEALTLDKDAEGDPVTKAAVEFLGSSSLWDLVEPGTIYRCFFIRAHGDKVLARVGQGIQWTPKRGERSARLAEPSEEEAKIEAQATSGEGSMFAMLMGFQRLARMEAKAEIRAIRETAEAQRRADREFMREMTHIAIGARREERRDEAAAQTRALNASATAARAAAREAAQEVLDEDQDDDAEAEEEKAGDALVQAVSGLKDVVAPMVKEVMTSMSRGKA